MALETRFPVPPVCTAYWTEADWERYIEATGVVVETEPDTLPGFNGAVWEKTGTRNTKGEALYRRKEEADGVG
jgi:hypothetical protein